MNYPNKKKSALKKNINYGNRGMDLENLINIACDYYNDNNIATIYKKPTPIQIVKYNYDTKRITDAYYKETSTLDYNGVYNGYYVEFDAKNTNRNYLPLSNIAKHQIEHIKKIIFQKGIAFLIIMINNECYAFSGKKLLKYIDNNTRKSIPYIYIKENGIKLDINYLKGIDYIKGVNQLISEEL